LRNELLAERCAISVEQALRALRRIRVVNSAKIRRKLAK
jgi:hypothetical protein